MPAVLLRGAPDRRDLLASSSARAAPALGRGVRLPGHRRGRAGAARGRRRGRDPVHGQPEAHLPREDEQEGRLRPHRPGRGSYKIFLTKEGYKKGGLDVPWLSLGGLSDLCSNNPGKDQPCEPLILKKAEVAISHRRRAGLTARAEGGAASWRASRAARRARPPRPPRRPPSSAPRTRRPSRRSRPSSGTPPRRRSRRCWRRSRTSPSSTSTSGHVYRQKKDYASGRGRVPEGDRARAREARRLRRAGGPLRGAGQGRGRGRRCLQKNAAAFEQDAKYQIALGATAMNQGKEKEAEAAFSKAVALDPANVEVAVLPGEPRPQPQRDGRRDRAPREVHRRGARRRPPNVEVAKGLLAALQAKKK